jgi:predicted nucleotidyltransferase
MRYLLKIVSFGIIFFSFSISADECTNRLNTYTYDLASAISNELDEKKKTEYLENLKRIKRYREKMTDCEAQQKMLDYLNQRDKNKPIDLFPRESYKNE